MNIANVFDHLPRSSIVVEIIKTQRKFNRLKNCSLFLVTLGYIAAGLQDLPWVASVTPLTAHMLALQTET